MFPQDPSRRQMLGGFFAGLFAWLFGRREAAAVPAPPPALTPTPAMPAVTEPLTSVTTYAYDAVGSLPTVSDAGGYRTTYLYDAHRGMLG